MRLHGFIVLSLAAITWTASAQGADPIRECLAATETSLSLHASQKLRAERAALLVCAAATCPTVVRQECLRRIDQVNAEIPTIVFTAKSTTGQELGAVKVRMDGEVIAERLDGSAITVDPGTHQFSFEAGGVATAPQLLIVHESEKGRRETITLAAPSGSVAPPALVDAVSTPSPASPDSNPSARSGSGWRKTTAIVSASLGVAGLAVGGAFAGLAASEWSTVEKECPTRTGCSTQAGADDTTAFSRATVSTAMFVVGGVLVATGVVLYLTSPKESSPSFAIGLTPGRVLLGGRF